MKIMKKLLMVSLLIAVFSFQLNSIAPLNKHVVKKGDTLYSISKQYKITVAEISKANAITANSGIKIGQTLLIPTKGNAKAQAINYKPMAVPSTPDTPYREEDIRPRAAMIEKPQPVAEIAKPIIVTEGLRTTSTNVEEYPVIFNQYSIHGYKIKRNKGAANYLSDITSGNQHLAFYNDAETGSVIRVTNLMNQKTIFVKVIGRVPPVDAGNEIAVKLSSKAAQDLGAADEKFLVEVASFSSN